MEEWLIYVECLIIITCGSIMNRKLLHQYTICAPVYNMCTSIQYYKSYQVLEECVGHQGETSDSSPENVRYACNADTRF